MESDITSRAQGHLIHIPVAPVRTDRILPEVRGVATLVALVLFVAWIVLYLFPTQTDTLFAWPITPAMSPMFMGAAYGAGAYFFLRVVLARRWHHVGYYFLGITAFTWLMGIATLLHWEAFADEPFSLACLLEPEDFKGPPLAVYTWLILYAVTPFLVPLLWLRNRGSDPGTPDPDDQIVPVLVRRAGALAGASLLGLGVFLFLFPTVALPYWPWHLTLLTARVVGAFLTAPGVALLLCARDPRWSAWRILVQHQAIAVALVLLAVGLLWGSPNNPQPDNPLTWAFVGVMALFLAGLLALLILMDGRRSRTPLSQP